MRKAYAALGTAHSLAQYLAINYYGFQVSDLTELTYPEPQSSSSLSQKQLDKVIEENEQKQQSLFEELERERQKRQAAEDRAELTEEQLKQAKAQAKARSQHTANSLQWDENKTRQLLIDSQLAQAGWDINDPEKVGIEVEVQHQPTNSGIGYIDYVLWDDDGTPLAVVEAKRSREHMQKGREQARYYAEGWQNSITAQSPSCSILTVTRFVFGTPSNTTPIVRYLVSIQKKVLSFCNINISTKKRTLNC
ncbi:type I restriction-modification system [Vibrio ishigakensis]|uniref:Type I restriction-modification system n=1 Tax=Vibrio ishigakensis TaxID=1481914 RepID=A0A0B8QG73_9VIBR|nr:type I restriction-modification system [Vibrio ishigakensis]